MSEFRPLMISHFVVYCTFQGAFRNGDSKKISYALKLMFQICFQFAVVNDKNWSFEVGNPIVVKVNPRTE